MTISSGARSTEWTLPVRANGAAQSSSAATPSNAETELARERFAGLLGLNAADLYTPSGAAATAPGSTGSDRPASTGRAAAARTAPNASQSVADSGTNVAGASQTAAADTQDGAAQAEVKDVPNVTLAAGTVVDGMVSAGPLSTGLASMAGEPVTALSGTRFLRTAPDAASFGFDPIAMIRNRLAKLGVDGAGIQLERWTDDINGPGGSRSNQYVRATWPNGVTENFAVERVLQNPDITAVEIHGLMLRGFQPA